MLYFNTTLVTVNLCEVVLTAIGDNFNTTLVTVNRKRDINYRIDFT